MSVVNELKRPVPEIISPIKTPQEMIISGGRIHHPADMSQFYVPTCIPNDGWSIRQAQLLRIRFGFFLMGELRKIIFPRDGNIVLRLPRLNPKTGETRRDPQIVGSWDYGNKKLTEFPSDKSTQMTDLMYRYFSMYEDLNLHRRS